MSCVTRLLILRGTTPERLAFTPLSGELVFDTDLNQVFVGDGTTAGGNPLTAEAEITQAFRNNTGATIPRCSVVYVNGAIGGNPTVALADNGSETTADNAFGITLSETLDNSNGLVLRMGVIDSHDTSAFGEGDILYLGTNGQIINTMPVTPDHAIVVGYCLVSNNTNGKILVDIRAGEELGELHDVLLTSPQDREILRYNSTAEYWENGTLNKSDVGLDQVDNTSDADKPVSTAQAAAIQVVQDDVNAHEARTDNPHSVTKTQLGLGNVDNTSDADKPVSTAQQAAIDAVQLSADAHASRIDNPHSVTVTQTGGETSAQLDARDTANRARANHTGTQTASTISDFNAAVQAAETDTTLTIVGNTLRYVGENGTNQDVDLSLYLDDTNLARLVSGTINGAGIATFTRDDSSTFTVDFSGLLDNQNASEVPVTPSGNLSSTNTQAALQELQGDIDTINSATYVNSVNGETGAVTDVAKTDEPNTFTENQSIETGNALKFPHPEETDGNDGTISAGTFTEGLNLVGSKTTNTGVRRLALYGEIIQAQNDGTNIFNGETSFTTTPTHPDPIDPQDSATKKYVDSLNINSLTDVDTTTDAPQVGDILTWDGVNWAPSRNTVGTIGNPVFSLHQASILNLTGRFYVNFGSNLFQASFNGGEMLILQYHHQSGTNPNLNVLQASGDLPIFDNSILGADLSVDPSRFGHISNSFFNQIPDSDDGIILRWQGESTGTGGIIDFNSAAGLGISYLRTGTGSFSGINSNFTPNLAHTAAIPASANGAFGDQGDFALTEFPFFQAGSRHWGIRGNGARWEVDDFSGGPNDDTIHRVWVKYE